MLGVSGAAISDTVFCTEAQTEAQGIIQGELVFGNVQASDNCVITDSTIIGKIIVENASNPLATFVLNNTIIVARLE